MGLFDFLRKKKLQTEAVPLEQVCYDIAYFLLPQYVFQDLTPILELYDKTPAAAGPFCYLMACQIRKNEPDMDIATTFRWHRDAFEDGREYLALEYPSPPPVDLEDADPIALLESGKMPVLAPYFSVVLLSENAEPEYFILGQAPLGEGTTVRQILDGGMNCNLGPGPTPDLDAFLNAIRERLSKRKS
ncbi:hypothetical protein [uncultured Gimesia sp.]|uniref:hypothetical protein n=1 Tax=uncultured Gimesia sp. TaxID=1678688 RepID=UPI0030D9114D|tara:strand:- start:27594 stop:28157 length:564 start_codon:yes stop_codon:yes gene_type:complete